MTIEDYKALRAKAATEGLYTGLLWLASFACYVGQFSVPNLVLGTMLFGFVSLLMMIVRLRSYRNANLDELPFSKAFLYALSVFLYASLIMALGQWAYFQFLDNGYLFSEYTKQMNSAEMQELLKGLNGFDPEYINIALEEINALRPIDLTFQFLSVNITLGLFLSIPIAFLTMGKGVKQA